MTQSDIIQSLCDTLVDDKITDDKPFKKEWEELIKWLDILQNYIKDDEKLDEIFRNYDTADGLYLGAMSDYYYREGFLCGARLALEICGYTNEKR